MAVNPTERAAVLADLRTLAAARAPVLDEVERTLTDGYAYALALESERLRLQRELERGAASLGKSPGPDRVAEIAGLARGVARADTELEELRGALALLRTTAERLRG